MRQMFKQDTEICDKPLAVKGLVSYRYVGNYGWIMIGAKDDADALSEANRSLSQGQATLDNLQIWSGTEYIQVKTPTFTVTRMCCVSGRCDKCKYRKTRQRIVHCTGLSEKSAEKHCAGWAAYAPKKIEEK